MFISVILVSGRTAVDNKSFVCTKLRYNCLLLLKVYFIRIKGFDFRDYYLIIVQPVCAEI